jgi:hypothetical protein
MPRQYRHASVSITPIIQATGDTEKALKTFEAFKERQIEGRKLVVLEAATLVMRFLRRKGPDIDDFSYKDLKAVFSEDQSGEVIVSIIGEQNDRVADLGQYEIAYLYPKGTLTPAAHKWYEVLRSYQPWPVDMYPMPTGQAAEVGLSVRRVSSAVHRETSERIKRLAPEIERRLSAVGINTQVQASGDERTVSTDLGFAIMQVEYGLGRTSDSHWRPALEALKGEMAILADKFKKYMVSGKESIFDIDRGVAEVSNIKELDSRLQERLGRSSGLPTETLQR